MYKDHTEVELNAHAEALKQFTEIIKRHDFFWFLGLGALLGAYRDGDIIPWDNDYDFETNSSIYKVKDSLTSELKKAGFKIVTKKNQQNSLYKIVSYKNGTAFVLRIWEARNGGWRLHYPHNYLPDKHWNNRGRIELRGITFPCPADIEGYLRYVYGPRWKIPVRKGKLDSDKTKQFSPLKGTIE